MHRRDAIRTLTAAGAGLIAGTPAFAKQDGDPFCGHSDPATYKDYTNAHDGVGTLQLKNLVPPEIFSTNLIYIHRGLLMPKSSIGEHLHRSMEEMYFIFDGNAEYTVNGKTSLLPARSCCACVMGDSHGIYNPGDRPLEWMNIGITQEKGTGGAINYDEDLTASTLSSPAPFRWAQFDRTLCKTVTGAHGGKGGLPFRRLWSGEAFQTNWEWIDHVLIPPDTSIGYHQHNGIEEVYYVIEGNGLMTVNDKTWEVGPGDANPCTLHDSHGIYNHTGKMLEIFVLAISMEKGVFKVNNWGDDLSGARPR